ncbi:unnamed protein product [Chrysodeixis includens]|uniref:Uncharacterized protein n=1 Tax=Chrysodeixis includens TaxID=689277 RepID=A0A9P0BVZ5_CHRIL|nr:unnamed protein product [Chrysodeixis includens]
MDISYDDEVIKQCFKCNEIIIDNLNIVNNQTNRTILLWNKFQIFVYENFEFGKEAKLLLPTFQIQDLIFYGNYLICLDCSGNVHTTTLKFKNAVQNTLTFPFQPRECNVMAISLYDEDYVICLKHESSTCLLSLHKINSEFSLHKNVILTCKEQLPLNQTRDKCKIKVQAITANYFDNLKNVFKEVFVNRNKYKLVVMSFDKLNIFGCIFYSNMTEECITLVKLYSCPSEICDLQMTEAGDLNIGLTIGSLLRIALKDLQNPEVIHLNIAIYKYLVYNETIIYTDGETMWRAENLRSKLIKFSQFFVRHIKDFIKHRDQIICTTFMNLIYLFSIDNDISYLKQQTTEEYCSASTVLNHSDCLKQIMEEVETNHKLIKTLTKEKNYITALSLSNRQDVMDQIIKEKVIVYENYQDAIAENDDIILTNNFTEYFDSESLFFFIKISSTDDHKLSGVLSNSIGDLRFHITFGSHKKLLKTISVKVTEPIKRKSFLIPLKNNMVDTTEVNVHIKMLASIPGAMDAKRKIWTVLYRKNVKLLSEHFIKFNLSSNKQLCLKTPQDSLDELILQSAETNFGNLFDFIDTLKVKPASKEWQLYVRLPDSYQELFINKNLYTKHLNSKKVNIFLDQFTSEDFLKSKSNLTYNIGNEKVKVEIYNDGFTRPQLKVVSENVRIALNIRNFLSDMIYYVFTDFGPGKEFVHLSTYTTLENLQKAVKSYDRDSPQEDIEELVEKFERDVIGVLPI